MVWFGVANSLTLGCFVAVWLTGRLAAIQPKIKWLNGRVQRVVTDEFQGDRYWVDVARGGLILKHVQSAAGRAVAQLTIKYNITQKFGRVPASWEARFLNGALSTNASVVDFTLNDPIPPDMFKIDYPPGTVVFDRDRSERSRVLPNGKKDVITPGSRGK